MYKLGFRTLDEVSEASEQELQRHPGPRRRGQGRADQPLRAEALEVLRQENITTRRRAWAEMTDRERLCLIKGVTERVAELLEQAATRRSTSSTRRPTWTGWRSPPVSISAAQRRVREGVVEFVEHERQG
jgi:N utilization substance protein A